MYRWCSYCQSFLGETEPLSVFALTHGICERCKPQWREKSGAESMARIRPLMEFFSSLSRDIQFTHEIEVEDVVTRSRELGIQPDDLLAGIMQPLLYEIGKQYAEGRLTVEQEHQFSAMIEGLIPSLRSIHHESLARNPEDGRYEVVMACMEGNFHSFGVRFVELYLQLRGVTCKSLYPSLPVSDIVEACQTARPKILGVSTSLPEQKSGLERLDEELPRLSKSERPTTLVGGPAASQLGALPAGWILHNGRLSSLLQILRPATA